MIGWLRSILVNREAFWRSWAFIVPLVLTAVVLALIMLVHYGHLPTGFSGKTLWDWIEMLGVPVSVVVIGGLLGLAAQRAGQRAELEHELATERAREATLREYLDHISELILNHGLQDAKEDSPVRAVAHARTLAAIRGLDGLRKGILVRFLHESELIIKEKTIIPLAGADLSGSDLSGADLKGCNLSGAQLSGADFYHANLSGVNLYLSVVDDEQLAEAEDLVGATMPDEREMTEDRWKTFKQS